MVSQIMNRAVIEGGIPELTRDRSGSIGSILVEQGRLSPAEVEEIQQFAVKNRLRFGDAALRLQLLTKDDIDQAIAQQFKYPILSRGGEHGVADDVVAAYLPQSQMIEPLRVLRSQISLRWVNPKERKILAIARPGRGEGRSWLAANLETVFEQMGDRLWLREADMRD